MAFDWYVDCVALEVQAEVWSMEYGPCVVPYFNAYMYSDCKYHHASVDIKTEIIEGPSVATPLILQRRDNL